ncbi:MULTISPECIES: [protein-PII] uridylyltransferase [unclassified Aureimonas]|uniref:[protein-PII] uridylyltransferase n=1 Tax=unclassified Aureimonas TaxID=2615206 RepID=UPI0006FD3112|nr:MULTISPECIES: [protein-PII] uridylyltransferase [unclassified Aureimonas]KQT64539.1 protein-PII uridylyltransferase [Aureimonas sp. Leaf427]KQT81724.1 protein-PII uridylyltransferase [Aureimonas sp. Leaf460]
MTVSRRAVGGPETEDALLVGILDKAALAAELDALAVGREQGAGASHAVRAEVLALLKRRVAEGRKAAEALLFAEGSGLRCARRLSALQDALLRAIYRFAVRHVFDASNLSAGERMTVVAVGGYGRGTLAPGSDIDLLFLLPYKQTVLGEQLVEYLLYLLWDLGFKVGHATRTVEDCIRLAKSDFTIRTAILERRPIIGDEALYAELSKRFDQEVVEGTSRAFIVAKLAERDARHKKSGDTRYLVEPNVKEGKGGLRDLNTLFWIAKDHYRLETSEQFVAAGVFSRREARLFHKAEDFLWAVRCHMHFLTGKAEERLSFDLQREIAARLGYNAHPGMRDVERFMKHYFLIAKDVGDLTGILCAALEEEEAKEAPLLKSFVRSLRQRARKIPGTLDFHVDNNRINVTSREVFQKDPVNLIRIFKLAASMQLEYHPNALHLIRRSLILVDAKLRENKEANSLFLDVLTDRLDPELHLRRMNEAGVLGRFIPDFGRIVSMMQFNMYHHYTVDEHLLRSIAMLSRIERDELGDELPVSTGIVKDMKDRVPLYVALLLHDIAKGRPEDHSVMGAKIARKLCPRLGLDERETDLVAWLVEDHLVLSMTAQQRDLNDRKTILDFAERVRTLDRLKLLTVLTVCDIRAVGPGVWNGWKGQLIRTLYWETEPVLTGGFSQTPRSQRFARARELLAERLADWSEAERAAYIDLHYQNYFLTVPLEEQRRHADFVRQATVAGRELHIEARTDAYRAITEIMVLAPDHPRLVSLIAGACAAAGANIADAQIFTMADGRALDIVTLNREFSGDEDEMRRAQRIGGHIRNLLDGCEIMPKLIAGRKGARIGRPFSVKPRVSIDNALSNQFTVVEVEGLDRPGLLADLTGALSDLSLDIRSAHISTYGEKVVDVFYVTDLTKMKVVGEARIGRIERRMISVFENPEAELSSPTARPSARAFGFASL